MTTADFIPIATLIESVTNSVNAVITTTNNNGYFTGQVVRVFVPEVYGMSIPYTQTTITVTGLDTFTTGIDTSRLLPFVQPTFVPNGYGFTSAQVVPISGTEDNITE